jgi:hypothetical protein
MRKSMVTFVAVVALLAPIAAFADTAPTPSQTASAICKGLQKSLGTTFAKTYANFGACVKANQQNASQDVQNAAKTCKAEQAADQSDPTGFAAAHGGKSFDQLYGSNNAKGKGADANALGKCVSQHVQQSVQQNVQATVNAAKTCKALLKSNPTGFATAFGKGKNAFGKCVKAKGKTSP